MLAQGSGEANDAKEYEEHEEPEVMRTGPVIAASTAIASN